MRWKWKGGSSLQVAAMPGRGKSLFACIFLKGLVRGGGGGGGRWCSVAYWRRYVVALVFVSVACSALLVTGACWRSCVLKDREQQNNVLFIWNGLNRNLCNELNVESSV